MHAHTHTYMCVCAYIVYISLLYILYYVSFKTLNNVATKSFQGASNHVLPPWRVSNLNWKRKRF